jgi:hypothetical protein
MSQEKAKTALSGQGVEMEGNPVLACLPPIQQHAFKLFLIPQGG